MSGLGLIGFGRVGRGLFRELHRRGGAQVRAVAEINPRGRDPEELVANLAYLLAHDSVYGPFPGEVSSRGTSLAVDGREIPCFFTPDPAQVDWTAHDARVLVEASGEVAAGDAAQGLLGRGVDKVILTRSEAEAHVILAPGLNLADYRPAEHHLVSCSTCTANALAPVLAVIDRAYGVQWAGVASVHPALSGDTMLDAPAGDFALGRSALQVRATNSGLAASTARLLPGLAGRISGMSFRVPTGAVNALLTHLALERPPREVADALGVLQEAADGALKGIMRVDQGWQGRPKAAGDFTGDPHSAVVDGLWLELTGPMLRLVIWHDNEYAYCCRVADVIEVVAHPRA